MGVWGTAFLRLRHKPGKAGLDKKIDSFKYSAVTARLPWRGVLFSLGGVAASTALLYALNMAPYNANMVFMLLTLIATVWFGLSTGVFTAVLGFLCFDFFFIPPYFTFVIDAGQGWTAVFLFLGTALFANQVAGRARESSRQAQHRAHEATALYDLATAVITKIDQTEMLMIVLQNVSEALNTTSCTLFLYGETGDGRLVETVKIEAIGNQNVSLPDRHPDLGIAQAVFNQNRPSFLHGQTSLTPNDASEENGVTLVNINDSMVAYIPLTYGSEVLGVMTLVRQRRRDQTEFSHEEKRLIQVFANHVALAVKHARLIQESAQVAALRDSDKLKSALLASVSHELRTPLTSIKTVTANLQSTDISWSAEERREFLDIIEQESNRLARLVTNMLDLSKIEAHALRPNFGWYYLPEIVEKVVKRLRSNPLLELHTISTSFAPDLPLARVDYLQMDQVITNLLENAAKYSPVGRPIMVQVEVVPTGQLKLPQGKTPDMLKTSSSEVLVVRVLDEGRGIPPGELEHIFDKFYRIRSSLDDLVVDVPGTGMGLAICKGIIEAHAGTIWAQNRLYGGTSFLFTLPITSLNDEMLADGELE